MESAPGNHNHLFGIIQIGDQLFRIHIDDTGAQGHLDQEVLTAPACAIAALTRAPGLGPVARLEAKIDQGIQRRICLDEDTAAIAAVATIGTASLDVFFTTKTKATVTAVACIYPDFCFVYEFHMSESGNLVTVY
jgi:hypothetical protein